MLSISDYVSLLFLVVQRLKTKNPPNSPLLKFLSKILKRNLHFRQFLRMPIRYPRVFAFFDHARAAGLFVNKGWDSLRPRIRHRLL